MIFIWGSKAEERKVAMGTFFCPNCLRSTPFSQRRVSRYFTFFFIPLFPMETLTEYVRCKRCLVKMSAAVLTMTEEEIRAMSEPWACAHCGNCNGPVEHQCLSCRRPRPVAHRSRHMRTNPMDFQPRVEPGDRYDY
jgi:hypothetical protein